MISLTCLAVVHALLQARCRCFCEWCEDVEICAKDFCECVTRSSQTHPLLHQQDHTSPLVMLTFVWPLAIDGSGPRQWPRSAEKGATSPLGASTRSADGHKGAAKSLTRERSEVGGGRELRGDTTMETQFFMLDEDGDSPLGNAVCLNLHGSAVLILLQSCEKPGYVPQIHDGFWGLG